MPAPHLLIVEARFYDHIADFLLEGAKAKIAEAGGTCDVVTVPGALTAAEEGGKDYDGFVALGCVIRGETYHFEIVSNESSRALMDIAIAENACIGNGILTVETEAQALERARPDRLNKGAGAAEAALVMIALRDRLGA